MKTKLIQLNMQPKVMELLSGFDFNGYVIPDSRKVGIPDYKTRYRVALSHYLSDERIPLGLRDMLLLANFKQTLLHEVYDLPSFIKLLQTIDGLPFDRFSSLCDPCLYKYIATLNTNDIDGMIRFMECITILDEKNIINNNDHISAIVAKAESVDHVAMYFVCLSDLLAQEFDNLTADTSLLRLLNAATERLE